MQSEPEAGNAGNAGEVDEAGEEVEVDENFDQYAEVGAPNFPIAVEKALEVYNTLTTAAQEELILIVVTRMGAVQFFGSGDLFPSNQEQPCEMGFLVTREDILEDGLDEEEADEAGDPEATPDVNL